MCVKLNCERGKIKIKTMLSSSNSSSSCSVNLSCQSPVVVGQSAVAQQSKHLTPPTCSCSNTWYTHTPPEGAVSPSPSPCGPLAGPYDSLDFPDLTSDSGFHSATSPIAVTGPPLAHGPYPSMSQLPVPGGGNGAAAFSLPPQLFMPQMNQGPVNFSPTPYLMGMKTLLF